jgi:hypothetical protein
MKMCRREVAAMTKLAKTNISPGVNVMIYKNSFAKKGQIFLRVCCYFYAKK